MVSPPGVVPGVASGVVSGVLVLPGVVVVEPVGSDVSGEFVVPVVSVVVLGVSSDSPPRNTAALTAAPISKSNTMIMAIILQWDFLFNLVMSVYNQPPLKKIAKSKFVRA